MTETRKIAAILVADVVGYSRLAGADEEGTLARLRALRSDLLDPAVAAHRGRIVKRTGDGSLIEFRSVVDATRCAIEVQSGMVQRNAGPPPDRRLELRVGIHLGDVVEEDDGDLMGDGVNIAARIESIAAPGAICLSEDAYRQVKGRLDLAVTDLGLIHLKNIAEPIRVYSLNVGAPAPAKPVAVASFDRPPAVRQYRRPLGAGSFRRRRHREPDHRSFAHSRGRRDRPKYGVHLQRQAARRENDRTRVERALCPRGQRSAGRKPHAGQRAAHRCGNG
jgi:class 3 adenylate cyclase